jgi:taurine transport system substrate-binding protein
MLITAKKLLLSTALLFMASGPALAQKKVIIGHFGDPAPYKSVVADGRLEKATGWNIEWRVFNSGAEVNAAMASGGISISEIGSVPLAAGASTGLDYQMISVAKSISSAEALIARNGSGIDKPADLKGKKIAVPIGSTAHFSLMGALKMFGLTEKDVQIIGMAPSEIAAAWSQNAIDATFIWQPVQARLRANGKVLITAGEVAKTSPPTFGGWVASTKFANENRAALVNFLKVMNDVNADYAKNKAAWTADSPQIKAIATNVGSAPADVVSALEGATYPDGAANMSVAWMGGGAAATMKSTAEFLKAAGRINAVADNYGKFVNAEFAKEAAGK